MSSKDKLNDTQDLDLLTEKLTKPALQRLLRRSGVKRISEPVFDRLRDVITQFSTEVIKNIVVFVKLSKRKTIQIEDLESALDILNIHLAAGLNMNTKTASTSLQSCNSLGKSGPSKTQAKSKKGSRAIKSIEYHQKYSECLAIPKANFDRLIRNITTQFLENARFSDGVIDLLQLVVENHIISICQKAYNCTIFSGRDTIHSKDIDLVFQIIETVYN